MSDNNIMIGAYMEEAPVYIFVGGDDDCYQPIQKNTIAQYNY